ncbi:MAG: FAD:protein FMN transferase [Pseudomonadota bacterium]
MKNKFLCFTILGIFFAISLPMIASAEMRSVERTFSVGTKSLSIQAICDSQSIKKTESRLGEIGIEASSLYTRLIMTEQGEINALPPKKAFPLSQDMFELVSEGLKLSEETDGWFDIASAKRTSFAFTTKDWRRLKLDKENKTISFKSKNMQIQLDEIFFAFLVDRLTERLSSEGYSNYSICIDNSICRNNGNDIYTKWQYQVVLAGGEFAKRAYAYWVSDIAYTEITPEKLGDELTDAKSGDKVRQELLSATAMAHKSTTATAMAIAAYTVGPKGAEAFIKRYPQIKAIIVTPKEMFTSLGMEYKSPDYQKELQDITASPDLGPKDMKLRKKEEE